MVNTRRTTLSGISTNRRVSMAAGFESNSNSKPSTSKTRKQRMSMAPRMAGSTDRRSSLAPPLASTTNASNRRKSMGVGEHRHSTIPPPTTMRTDPRTISDKVYFNQCVRRLHRYLDQNGYEHPMKLKDLSRPSAKDFHNFMTFLLRKVDPSFNTSPKRKFEDDVVVAFKVIGYPFNISKTALVAAGSPHTWPTLLLSITWLIEVLEGGPGLDALEDDLEGIDSVGEAGRPFESIEKLEARTEQAFLKYVEISYGSFLSGDDAHFEKLELEFLDYNEKDNMVIEQTIERVMDENVAAENEYAEFCKEGGDLPEREKHLEDLANDIEKFEVLVQQLTEHKNALVKRVQESKSQLEEKENILEKKHAKLEHLREVIQHQEFSMEDIHRLENEVANIQEKIRQTKLAKERNEDATLAKARTLEKSFGKLHSIVEMFNSKLVALFSDDSDQISKHTISIQKMCAHQDQMHLLGGVDLEESVLPSWGEEKFELGQKISKLRRDLLDLTDKKESSEEKVADRNEEISLLEDRNQRYHNTHQAEQEQQNSLYDEKQQHFKSLQETIQSLQDPGSFESSIKEYQEQLEELESERKQKQEGYSSLKEDVVKEFNDFMRTYAELMAYQDKVLRELKDYKDEPEDYEIKLLEKEKEMLFPKEQ